MKKVVPNSEIPAESLNAAILLISMCFIAESFNFNVFYGGVFKVPVLKL